MPKKNKWSRERIETNTTNDAMLEHMHRYVIANELVKDLIVLDIACGEGYGTNLLASSAKEITGIDIDYNTISNAQIKYTKKNIRFKKGSISQIPEPDSTYDAIVCFETLEHITEHEIALKELKRVIKPDGILIISTPDKRFYSDLPNYQNPFHKKELYEQEFKNLISAYFKFSKYYSQCSMAASIILEEGNSSIKKFYSGDYVSVDQFQFPNPVFRIAIASDNHIPEINTSIFFHNKSISTLLFDEANEVKKTGTYKLGKAILYPIRSILSLFSK